MRLLLPLAFICLLAGQAQSRVLLQGSRQFVQWGLALLGRCNSFPAKYNVTLNEALREDIDSPLKRAYGEECKAVTPTYPNQPDAPDSPLPCADYRSPLDGKDYALFRLTVRLDCDTPAGNPPPTDELQNRTRSLLNKYWNENGTPNQCTGPCGFLEHPITFAAIIRVLGTNVCARSRGAEMKPSTNSPDFGRVPLEQVYPCIGRVQPSPSPSPSQVISPSPSPFRIVPSPSPTNSPPSSTCGNTGNGLPYVCVSPFVNRPNSQNITNPSTTTCCECATAVSVEAFDVNSTLVQCLNPAEPCPNQFPITVRPFTGTPPEACLARGPNTVCPPGFTFPFFATIGAATVLTNCWPENILNSSNDVCQITIASGPTGSIGRYGIPVLANFTSSRPSGCLLDGSSTCPAAFPFTNMTAAAIAACFSPQTTCNAPGGSPTAGFAVRVFSAGHIVGCADITNACPSTFPIEASTSVAADPSQCYATNMGCTLAFSFALYSGNSLERCVQPIPNIATCANGNFGAFTGAALYSITAANGFTGCSSTPSCPTAFPTFYQNEVGVTERCSLPISGGCSLQFSGQYGISVRNGTSPAIAGCRSGSICGTDDVTVSETFDSTALQCLTPGITSCPSGLFPLFSGGTVNGAPKLLRCVNAINAQNCDAVGMFTAEVFGNSAGEGPVVACMTPTSTPCPASSSFATMSDAATITSCRVASGATCDGNHTKLVAAGGATVGCINPASNICPTGAEGQAYNYPFFFRGMPDGTARMAECRSTPVPLPAACDSGFPVEVYDNIFLGLTDDLVGCMRENQACSVPGFTFTILTGTTGSAVDQCRPSGVQNCAPPFPLTVGGANALEGCMSTTVTSCGNSNFPFSIFGNAATPPARPTLTECRVRPASSVPVDCSTLISINVGIEIYSGGEQVRSNWIGCTRGDSRCPQAAQVFSLTAGGGLDACLATGTACTNTQISISNSFVATTAAPLSPVGCMARGVVGEQPCPNVANEGDYSFFVVGATDRILRACHLRATSALVVNSCATTGTLPNLINMYRQESPVATGQLPTVPNGCLLVTAVTTSCPTGDITGATIKYDFELLSGNPEVLVGCVHPAESPLASTTCAGLGRFSGSSGPAFSVMINDNDRLSAVTALRACFNGTTCPSTNTFSVWTGALPNPAPPTLGLAPLLRCVAGGALSGSSNFCDAIGRFSAPVMDRDTVPGFAFYMGTTVGCVVSPTAGSYNVDIRACPQEYPGFLWDAPNGGLLVCQRVPSICAPNGGGHFVREIQLGPVTVGCVDGEPEACDLFVANFNKGVNVSCSN